MTKKTTPKRDAHKELHLAARVQRRIVLEGTTQNLTTLHCAVWHYVAYLEAYREEHPTQKWILTQLEWLRKVYTDLEPLVKDKQ
jgi:hypothetical protein